MRHAFRPMAIVAGMLFAFTPAVDATGAWVIEATVSQIEIGRASSFSGSLGALILENVAIGDPLAPSSFTLHGDSVRVELDYAHPSLNVGMVTSARHSYGMIPKEFASFEGQGGINRNGYQLVMVPLGSGAALSMTSSCAEAASPGSTSIDREAKVVPKESRAPLTAAVEQSVMWSDCSAMAQVTVIGDFLVALWEWDFVIEARDSTHEYATGRLQADALYGAPDLTAIVSRDQQAFLFVTNGTLGLQLERGVPHEIYAGPLATVHSDLGALLGQARGQIRIPSGMQEFTAQVVEMTGVVDLEIDADEGQLKVRSGNVDGLRLDGVPVQLAAVATVPDGAPRSLLVAFAGLAVLLFAFLFALPPWYHGHLRRAHATKLLRLPDLTWSDRQAAAFIVMGDNAHHASHPLRTLAFATLAGLFSNHPQIGVLRTKAYRQLAWHRAALRVHVRLDKVLEQKPRQRARNAWYAAQSATDPDAARAWRQMAQQYDAVEFLRLTQALPEV